MKGQRDEELLKSIAGLAREEAEDDLADPRWDALAEGTATAEDELALAEMASRSDAARDALSVFAPLGPDANDRFAASIAANLAESRAREAATEPRKVDLAPSPANDAAPVASLAAARARKGLGRRVIAITSALAMAAGLLFFLVARPHGDPALPDYALSFTGGHRQTRTLEPVLVPVFRPGAGFTATLRPATSEAGPVGARAYLVKDGLARPLAVEVSASPDGAVKITGSLDAAGSTPGEAEIVLVVARPDAMLPASAGAAALAPDEDGARRVLRQKVRIDRAE